jgi:chitin disaccharide deacetylase
MFIKRYLIVNADDLGLSTGINEGIIKAYEEGVVTSASLMVRYQTAADAAAYARRNKELSVGIHVDLAEWIYKNGEWVQLYQMVDLNDIDAISTECFKQLDSFQQLMGEDPTHVDCHQHLHRHEPVRSVLVNMVNSLSVPLRDFNSSIRYCGDFYGQTSHGYPLPELISVDHLLKIIRALPEGITELGCHPSLKTDLDTIYCHERLKETEVLCDPQIKAAIIEEGIELCSFRNVIKDCASCGCFQNFSHNLSVS